jgi:amino acid transporter
VSELRDPKRTLSIAGPTAVGLVGILYVLTNVAYFAVIPLEQMATSDVVVAGVFFKAMFGDNAGARCLPAFVALSNIGNVLAMSYANARVNRECAKQGLLPWSRFWASLKPFGTPTAAVGGGLSQENWRF